MVPIATHLHPTVASHSVPMIHQNYTQHGAARPTLSIPISSYGLKQPINIPVSSVGMPIPPPPPPMRQQTSSFIARQLPPIEEPHANPTLKYRFYQKGLSIQNLVEESKNQLEKVSENPMLVSTAEEVAELSFVPGSNDYKHVQSVLQKKKLSAYMLYHRNVEHPSNIIQGSNVSDHIYQDKGKSVDVKGVSQRTLTLPKDHLSVSNSSTDRWFENESSMYRDHSWLSDVVSTHDPHFDVLKCHTNLIPIPSHHQLREIVYAHSKTKNNDKTGIKRKKLDVGEMTRFTDGAALPSLKESILHHNSSNSSMEMPHLSDVPNSRSFGPRQSVGSSISYGSGQLRNIQTHDKTQMISSKRNIHGNSYNHPPPLIDVTSNSNRAKSQCFSDSGMSSKPICQVVYKRSSSISKHESREGMSKHFDELYNETSCETDRDYVGGHIEDLISDPDYTPIDCSHGLEDSLSNNHKISGAHQNFISSSSVSSGRKRTVKSDTFISRKRRSLMENVRKEIVRNFKMQVNNKCAISVLAKKTSVACQKIIRRDALKSQKLTKEITSRSKKVIRESCMFWKKFERLEKEHRKRIHKQVMEQKQMEVELKEMKRQQRKLNYLITQTELFAHFMSGKQIGIGDTHIKGLKNQPSTVSSSERTEYLLASQDEESMRTTERILSSLDTSFENHQIGATNLIRLAPGTEVEVAGKKFLLTACDSNKESNACDVILNDAQNQSKLEDEEDYQVVRSRLIENTLEAVNRQRMNISQFSLQKEPCQTNNSSQAALSKPPESCSMEDFQIPSIFQGKLKPYQIHGVMWLCGLYEKGINGILADEMGLGKTVQTIAILSYLAEIQGIWGPFMVVAPASTLHNWQQEISRFVPSFKILPYWGNSFDRKSLRTFWNQNRTTIQSREDSPFHVLISSYQLIVRDFKYFQRIRWQYMVLDEAQAIKSSSSQRWKSLLSFNCRNRLLLTGTPIQNNMAELWALLHFIMPTLFDSHQEFNDWFSKDIEAKLESNSMVDQNQLTRLHMILKPFMLRRVKKEVENELSDKIEIDLPCELSYRQRLLYQAIKSKISVDELILLSTTGATSISSHSVINPTRGRKNNKALSSAQEDEFETQGNNFSVTSGNANHLMNIVMQFRKVCNHPELFERKHRLSPLFFNLLPATLTFPKILFDSDIGDNDQGNRYRKFFLSKLTIFSPEKVLQDIRSSDISKNQSFGFCLFFPRISINSICNVLLGDMIARILMYLSDLKQDSARWSCVKIFSKSSPNSHKNQISSFCDDAFSRFSRSITNVSHHLRILSRFNNSTSMFSDIPSGFNDYKIISLKSSSLETQSRKPDSVKNINHSNNNNSEPMDLVDTDQQFTDGKETSKCGYPSEVVVRDSLVEYPRFIQRFALPAAIAHITKFSCTSPAALHHQELFHDCSTDNYKFLMTGKFQQNYEHSGTSSSLFLPNDDISGFYQYYNTYGGNSHVKSLDPMYMVEDSGKIRLLDNLLPSLKAEGHRVLIYSQMTRMIDLLEEYLTFRKYRYLRLDGSSKICDRRQMVADFQSNSNIFAFLLSTRAGGLGINLTAADTVIFYDSDWNPTVDQQAMDRAHRLGQTRQVTVYRLICQGTIEEKIQSRARKKSEIQRMVIAGNRFTAGRGFVQNSGANEAGHETEDGSSVSGQIKQREVLDLLLDEAEVEEKFRARHAERQAALLDSDGNKKRGRKRKLKLSNVLSEENTDDAKRMLIDSSSKTSLESLNLSSSDSSNLLKVSPIPEKNLSQTTKTRKPRSNNAVASGAKKTAKSPSSLSGSVHAATRAALIAGSMAAYTSLGYKLIPDPSSTTNFVQTNDSVVKNPTTTTTSTLRNPSLEDRT